MAAADFWWLVPSPRDDGSPKANHQISPGITHSPSRLSLSDLRRNVRASIGLCIYWPAHPAASPLSAGCSSEQRFACSFLRIPPHDGHPCCSANTSPCRVCRGLTPPSECALPGAHRVGGGISPAVLPHHTDVPFGIRRFMKQTGSVGECPSTKPAPCGRTSSWGRLGSYARLRRSTTGRAHW